MTGKTPPSPEQKRLIRRTFYITGGLFFAAGLFSFCAPGFLAATMGMEEMAARVFASTLMLIGVTDIIVFHFLFDRKDRR